MKLFEWEIVDKRIREWLGWESIGLVITENGNFVEHFARDETYEVRNETRQVKRIISFYQVPEWHNDLNEILTVIEDTPLEYQIGKIGKDKYFANIKCGENITESIADSLSYALSKAFIKYLDKYGTSWIGND